ncbi:Lrp/AsnC family transcriptional regulator [Shouchella shacheensis]|uniref:Lrp/AsnC family transcriptional regulator n=1 Tax=Shouchella shacheensis TaxID=1649580 RepID=UPI0007402749|nr:Lrp/AsnC family transcriptional regulator [Shouchella shacheensis]
MSKLDTLDFSVLSLLQENGKASYSDIARKLSVSEGTIRSRIGKMVKDGVFEFIIHVNPNKVGLCVQAIIGLTTKLGRQEEVAGWLHQFPEVRFVAAFSGKHDLMLQAYFSSNEELVHFVNKELAKLDGIDTVDVSIELKQYKDSFSYAIPKNSNNSISS